MLAPTATNALGPERVLLVRLTALGDVILVAPLVRAMRAAWPGVAIDLLTDQRLAEMVTRLALFDRVIGWDRHGVDAGLGGVLRVRRRLLTGGARYRAVLDLQGKLRTRALTALLAVGRRATLQKRSVLGALRAMVGRERPIVDRHTVDMYLDAAAALGLPRRALAGGTAPRALAGRAASPDGDAAAPGPTPEGPHAPPQHGAAAASPAMPAPPSMPAAASPAMPAPPSTPATPPRRIGFGAGTTHATKRWPHFGALAAELSASYPDARFVVIGGPSDRAELDAIRAAIPAERLDPCDTAALDPVGLLDLLGTLDVLVSVDSGAAHVAQALGVPTLVLFGPTSPARWGPREPPHRALTLALPCAPCSNVGGRACPVPERAHACMRDLAAADAARAVRELVP